MNCCCYPALPALYLKPENSTNVAVQDANTGTREITTKKKSANVTYLVNLKLMMKHFSFMQIENYITLDKMK